MASETKATSAPDGCYVYRSIALYWDQPWTPLSGVQSRGFDPDPLSPHAGAPRGGEPKTRGFRVPTGGGGAVAVAVVVAVVVVDVVFCAVLW